MASAWQINGKPWRPREKTANAWQHTGQRNGKYMANHWQTIAKT